MKREYGIFTEEKGCVQRFDKEESITAFKTAQKLTETTGKKHFFRSIQFSDLSDNEKLSVMEEKLEGLQTFLEEMKGSGQTYYSSIAIDVTQLDWLVEKAKSSVNPLSDC